MMLIEAKEVFLCMLLAAAGIVCAAATNDSDALQTRVKSNESKSNDTRRTCSKLEYYDKLKQKCRDFPGGGILVIMDHSTKCAHGDSGLHTFSRRDYYYVCNPEGVMIGLCPDSTVFSDTEKRCITQTHNHPCTIKMHDESRNCNIVVPDCNGVGLFPIPSNCSFYFKCQEHNYDFYQYVYQCPPGKVFHPNLLRCSSSNKCYDGHEDILNNFNKDYFPECHIFGQFRTAKDCTLYYRCVPNMDGSFYQIRYECPYKMYYNIEKEICMPDVFNSCDYIPHERIIEDYKLQHRLEASSSDAQPTTIISAINTKITSSMPTYYDTTRSLDANEVQSLVQEVSESCTTTEQVPHSSGSMLEGSSYDADYGFPSEQDQPFYQDTDIDNGASAEERPNTEILAMSKQSYTTEETFTYSEAQSTATNNIDSVDEEFRTIRDYEESIESSQPATLETWYPGEPIQSPTEPTLGLPEDEPTSVANDAASEAAPRSRNGSAYEEMVWDSGAWDFPNRSKPVAAPVTADESEPMNQAVSGATDGVSSSTNWPDHYPIGFEANTTYSSSSDGEYPSYESETGCTGETFPTNDPYSTIVASSLLEVSPTDDSDESMDDMESTISSHQTDSGSLVRSDEMNSVDSPPVSSAAEINCTTDNDGELVCNGQRLSVNGYLEILGYALKFTKWEGAPDRIASEPGPIVNIQLSLRHPFSYMLEANATSYRSSFSYDYPPATTEHTNAVDILHEDNGEFA